MAEEPRPLPADDSERDLDRLYDQDATPQDSPLTDAPAHESVRQAVQRMWDVVRKGADVIVTLRQENQILQNQMQSLRKSETELQARVEDFLQRIDALEHGAIVDGNPGQNIDRLEDRVAELESALQLAHEQLEHTSDALLAKEAELTEVTEQLHDQVDVTQQLSQLRSELEARTQLLQELQDSFDQRQTILPAEGAAEPDAERDRLQAELDRALEIIDRYRSAGLRHLEDPDTEHQLTMFEQGKVDTSTLTNEELMALASRLEGVAKRLDELFGLS